MKSIIYFLFACLITFSAISTSPVIQAGTKTIIIKPSSATSSSAVIEKSAIIISARLKVFGIANPVVTPLTEKGQIKVQVPDNYTISEIEGLLTLKGELAFYETLNRKELNDLLNGDNKLFGLLNSDPGISPTEARIGCIPKGDISHVNTLMNSLNKQGNCLLSWGFLGFSSNENLRCLYALKTIPMLNRSDIELVKSEKAKDGESYNIMVTFKKQAAAKFGDATSKNLNHAIAITMDNYVYAAPVVKDAITGGVCEISGNNTEKDVNYFLALVNNGTLPVSFEIMK
jgi:preprotein translocase subunit SecD